MARYRNITGVETVQRVFRELPRESAERIANALNLGGKEIADAAKLLVPVGDYSGAGDLKESIDVDATGIRARADGRSAVVFVVAGTGRDEAIAYAFQQEFGRNPGGSGVNADHPGHTEQPFMFPAYWARRRRVRSRIKREIKRAAKVVAALGRA